MKNVSFISVEIHWASYDRLEKEFPEIEVKQEVKFVDEGNVITSGGI